MGEGWKKSHHCHQDKTRKSMRRKRRGSVKETLMSETHRYALNLCQSRYKVKTWTALNHTVLLCWEGCAARHDFSETSAAAVIWISSPAVATSASLTLRGVMSPSPPSDVMFGDGAQRCVCVCVCVWGGGGCMCVCVCLWTWWWQGGGRRGGSYLFVLPSRRVREQIKGFSLRGGTDLNSSPICIPGWWT